MQDYKDWLTKLGPEDMPNDDLKLVADCCGVETAIRLLQEMGGVTLNIPKLGGKRLYQQYIKDVCDGSVTSMRRIALHLGVTQSYVEKIYRGYLDGHDDDGRDDDDVTSHPKPQNLTIFDCLKVNP